MWRLSKQSHKALVGYPALVDADFDRCCVEGDVINEDRVGGRNELL